MEDYTYDYINGTDIYLYQHKKMFRINTDTALLAQFMKVKKGERVLDIGTNNGALLLAAIVLGPTRSAGAIRHWDASVPSIWRLLTGAGLLGAAGVSPSLPVTDATMQATRSRPPAICRGISCSCRSKTPKSAPNTDSAVKRMEAVVGGRAFCAEL